MLKKLFFLLAISLVISKSIFAQELPIETDLSKFQFKISEIKIVEKISSFSTTFVDGKPSLGSNSITTKEGYNLIKVKLIGTSDTKCELLTSPSDFSVVYNVSDGNEEKLVFVSIAGIAFDEILWIFQTNDISNIVQRKSIRNPGEFNIFLAFELPVNVTKFKIRYYTYVEGDAEIHN